MKNWLRIASVIVGFMANAASADSMKVDVVVPPVAQATLVCRGDGPVLDLADYYSRCFLYVVVYVPYQWQLNHVRLLPEQPNQQLTDE